MRNTLRLPLSALALAPLLLPAAARAQWAWAKPVSISQETTWDGAARDAAGNLYLAGVSSRLPAPDTRAFVVAKYRQDTAKAWTAALFGGGFTTRHSEVGVDSAGNVYAIGLFTNTVRRADSTTFSHFLEACFIAKYDSSGKEKWVKKLTTGNWTHFQVLPDGTLGLLLPNFNNATVLWGDSTLTVPKTDLVMEISADGELRRVLSVNDVSPASALRWLRWTAPGKVRFVHGKASLYAGEADVLKVSEMDLETKAATHRPDSAAAVSTQSRELSFGQMEYEESSGHLFVMMTVRTGSAKLNGTDSLAGWPNNLLRLNHLVELDEKMAVVRRISVTNPAVFAVRDSQVALAAMVHRTAGFVSDHGTLTTKSPDDAHMLYLMDREFKFKKKAHIESPGHGNSGNDPRHVFLDADGDVLLHMTAAHSLSYHRAADTVHLSAPLSTSAQITAVSMLSNGAATGLSPARFSRAAPVRAFLTAGRVLRLEHPGPFAWTLADPAGRAVEAGRGQGRAERDVRSLARGVYTVHIRSQRGRTSLPVILH